MVRTTILILSGEVLLLALVLVTATQLWLPGTVVNWHEVLMGLAVGTALLTLATAAPYLSSAGTLRAGLLFSACLLALTATHYLESSYLIPGLVGIVALIRWRQRTSHNPYPTGAT